MVKRAINHVPGGLKNDGLSVIIRLIVLRCKYFSREILFPGILNCRLCRLYERRRFLSGIWLKYFWVSKNGTRETKHAGIIGLAYTRSELFHSTSWSNRPVIDQTWKNRKFPKLIRALAPCSDDSDLSCDNQPCTRSKNGKFQSGQQVHPLSARYFKNV